MRGATGNRRPYRDQALFSSGVEHLPRRMPQLAALAVYATTAAGDAGGCRELLEGIGPSGVAKLLLALGPDLSPRNDATPPAYGAPPAADVRMAKLAQLLEATTYGSPSEVTAKLVQDAFVMSPMQAYEPTFDGYAAAMSKALAHHMLAHAPDRERTVHARLLGVLETEGGRQALAHPGLTLEDRLTVLRTISEKMYWNKEFFAQLGGLDTNAELASTLTNSSREMLAKAGDQPRRLNGTDLENIIGFSMGFRPQGIAADETKGQRDQREAAAARGEHSYFQEGAAGRKVQRVASKIREIGGNPPDVTVSFVEHFSSASGHTRHPLFRVNDDFNRRQVFVDGAGRVYQQFPDWEKGTDLPPGMMTYWEDGKVGSGIYTAVTPNTVDTTWESVKHRMDQGLAVGGTVAGVALSVESGGTLAPLVLGMSHAWGFYRSGEQLVDRWSYGQSLNPLNDGDAWGPWLALGANAGSLWTSTGLSAMRSLPMLKEGEELATSVNELAKTVAAARVVTNFFDAGAAMNAGVDLFTEWDNLDGAARTQLMLSAGFFGFSMLGNTRRSGASPSEMFSPRAIRDGLLSTNPFRAFVEGWQGLSVNVQNALRNSIGKLGSIEGEVLAKLVTTPGFRGLKPEDQDYMLLYVGGRNEPISEPGRRSLARLLEQSDFKLASPAEQTEKLNHFLVAQPGAQSVLEVPYGVFKLPASRQLQGESVDSFTFASGEAPATRYQLSIGEHTVEVYSSNLPPVDGNVRRLSPTDLDRALRALPPHVSSKIKQVFLDARPSPNNEYWAEFLGQPEYTGYMGADWANRTVHVYGGKETPSLKFTTGSLAHEVGHFESNAAWGPRGKEGAWQPWKDAIAKDRTVVSKYAQDHWNKGNPREDFAEAYELYHQVKGTLIEPEIRELMPNRFQILDDGFASLFVLGLLAKYLAANGGTGIEHPGTIAFVDGDADQVVAERSAAQVPESQRYVEAAGAKIPIVRVVATTAGDERTVREYGPEGLLLRSTFLRRQSS